MIIATLIAMALPFCEQSNKETEWQCQIWVANYVAVELVRDRGLTVDGAFENALENLPDYLMGE